jgi:uncharacterized protein YgiM (DUF1202 family)
MSLRSVFARVGIVAAGGALVTSVAVTPALADEGWGGGGDDPAVSSQQHEQSSGSSGHGGEHENSRLARGVVTASELNLRSAPNRGSQVIRVAHRGERVSIFCKTPGQPVQGNHLWYLLTDGTWAWGSARYIETIGTPPRWC